VAVEDLLAKILVIVGACEVMVLLTTWYLCDFDDS
jgi:hypothetical protein